MGGRRKTACGRHRYVCAQLVELPALLIRQPIRNCSSSLAHCLSSSWCFSREVWSSAWLRSGWTPFSAVRGVDSSRFAGSRWHEQKLHPVDRRPEEAVRRRRRHRRQCHARRRTAGDLQCIIGPNGAGKSTFFTLFFAAFIELDGLGGGSSSRGRTSPGCCLLAGSGRGWGLTFQTNRVFGSLSVRQNLEDSPLASIRRRTGNFG